MSMNDNNKVKKLTSEAMDMPVKTTTIEKVKDEIKEMMKSIFYNNCQTVPGDHKCDFKYLDANIILNYEIHITELFYDITIAFELAIEHEKWLIRVRRYTWVKRTR